MPVYAIAQGRVHDPKKHDAYVAAAVHTLPAEAKLLCFDLDPEVIEGPVSHPTELRERDRNRLRSRRCFGNAAALLSSAPASPSPARPRP